MPGTVGAETVGTGSAVTERVEVTRVTVSSSVARMTTATVRPATAISAAARMARSWTYCARRTTAGCFGEMVWLMCAPVGGAARSVVGRIAARRVPELRSGTRGRW